MRKVPLNDLGLTLEQVRVLMAGGSPIRSVRPGDEINWKCNWVGDHLDQCPFRITETVTEYNEHPDWPEALIEHIWLYGHMDMTTDDGHLVRPRSAVRTTPSDPYRKPFMFLLGLNVGVLIFETLRHVFG